jgi:hypothetical protein
MKGGRFMRLIKPVKFKVFFVCLIFALTFAVIDLSAQEKMKISGEFTLSYTNMDSVVVGDIEGHNLTLSVSEGKNVNTGEHMFMNGAEIVNISYGDLVQGNGVHTGYVSFIKNGDVTYAKWEGKVSTVQVEEGTLVTSFEGTYTYIKGTGKFENIEGNGTYKGKFIEKDKYTVEWQGEYSIKK